ncbi:MAG: nitroreductase family protein [Clostridia bacterium]|nr:nitroreductase family protein [Clostridia bacterium]
MENLLKLIETRESCRNFDTRPVDKALLCRMVEAARLSPSACNSQPWRFTVVSGEKRAALAQCTQGLGMNKFTNDAPAFIVISEEKATLMAKIAGSVKDQHYAPIDIGLTTAHLCLAATALGLSTCILGWFDEAEVKALLGDTVGSRIRLILAVGYAKNDSLRPKKRKDMEEILYFGD